MIPTKKELRIYAKKVRDSLNVKELSAKIMQNLVSTDFYKNSLCIALYYPFSNELDLRKIFTDTTKQFCLPVILENDEMKFVTYKLEDELDTGKYGILEPENKNFVDNIDLIILPALMADKSGYRLGYGKGYYDKFLHKNNFIKEKVICIPEELFVNELPYDSFDIPANAIITENNVYHF